MTPERETLIRRAWFESLYGSGFAKDWDWRERPVLRLPLYVSPTIDQPKVDDWNSPPDINVLSAEYRFERGAMRFPNGETEPWWRIVSEGLVIEEGPAEITAKKRNAAARYYGRNALHLPGHPN